MCHNISVTLLQSPHFVHLFFINKLTTNNTEPSKLWFHICTYLKSNNKELMNLLCRVEFLIIFLCVVQHTMLYYFCLMTQCACAYTLFCLIWHILGLYFLQVQEYDTHLKIHLNHEWSYMLQNMTSSWQINLNFCCGGTQIHRT